MTGTFAAYRNSSLEDGEWTREHGTFKGRAHIKARD